MPARSSRPNRDCKREYARLKERQEVGSVGYHKLNLGLWNHSAKVPEPVAAERDKANSYVSLDNLLMGTPAPGRSALDRLRAKENSVFR